MRSFRAQFIPLAALAILVSLLLIFDLRDLGADFSRWPRLALEVGALLCSFLIFDRVRRRVAFSSELIERLRRIQNGEPIKGSYFRAADGAEDRSIGLAFSEAMKIVHRRFESVLQERVGEEAVLASMAEGVLVIDPDECVMRLNDAAAQLLGVAARQALGRSIQETVRNVELQKFVRLLLKGEKPAEQDIEVHVPDERFLQMTGRELRNLHGDRVGGIVVLSDVTRLRRLERTRSDFIANVSHELKTPVTAIRGFAETLLDGALDQPNDARRFTEIISRQAERLSLIFDDMLVLSRLEQEVQTDLVETELEPIVKAAVQSCEMKASARDVKLAVILESGLSAQINAALLEQAVVNLVDNAVKYSGSGTDTTIRTGRAEDGRVFISVQDNGCGIDAAHLPRIFERFYRIDRGRSRAEGGTGLGLAIVKHIAQSQGGFASVESTVNKGSTFKIYLNSTREHSRETPESNIVAKSGE